MLLVGIDVGKSKHSACFMTVGGEVLRRKFAFENDSEGFSKLEQQAKFFQRGHNLEGLVYGMEPSSVYWQPLYHQLGADGGECVLTNPLWVKRNRQTYTMSPDKNDDKDAYSIGDMLKQGKFSLPLKRPRLYKLLRARLDRYDRLLEDIQRVKARFRLMLGVVFPEVEKYFKQITAESLLYLLEKWPTPAKIMKLAPEELVAEFRAGKMRLARRRILEIHRLAGETIGLTEEGEIYTDEVRFYVRELRRLLGEMLVVVTEVEKICHGNSSISLLLSMKGIGVLTKQ